MFSRFVVVALLPLSMLACAGSEPDGSEDFVDDEPTTPAPAVATQKTTAAVSLVAAVQPNTKADLRRTRSLVEAR